MTIYRAEDFELAARRIEAFMERGDPGGVGRKYLRAAEAGLLISANVMRPGLLEATLDAAHLLPKNIPVVATAIRAALTGLGD